MRKTDIDKLDALIATVERRAHMRSTMTDDEAAAYYSRSLEDDHDYPAFPLDARYRILITDTAEEAAEIYRRFLEDQP